MSNILLPIDFCREEISFHLKNKKVNHIQILKGKNIKLANMNAEQLMEATVKLSSSCCSCASSVPQVFYLYNIKHGSELVMLKN